MKLTIHQCAEHSHKIVALDGVEVISNDYSIENVLRIAEHLNWEVETIWLDYDEFAENFA